MASSLSCSCNLLCLSRASRHLVVNDRLQLLKKVDQELRNGNDIAALTLVKDLQGKPGGLRCFGAARQTMTSLPNEEGMITLKDLVPAATNNVNTRFILVEKGVIITERACMALVADETAAVHFQLWGTECDAFAAGDIIRLSDGIFSYHKSKSNLVLRAGKRGKTEKVGEFTMLYVETPNMSEISWKQHPSHPKKFVQDGVIASHSRLFPPPT